MTQDSQAYLGCPGLGINARPPLLFPRGTRRHGAPPTMPLAVSGRSYLVPLNLLASSPELRGYNARRQQERMIELTGTFCLSVIPHERRRRNSTPIRSSHVFYLHAMKRSFLSRKSPPPHFFHVSVLLHVLVATDGIFAISLTYGAVETSPLGRTYQMRKRRGVLLVQLYPFGFFP